MRQVLPMRELTRTSSASNILKTHVVTGLFCQTAIAQNPLFRVIFNRLKTKKPLYASGFETTPKIGRYLFRMRLRFFNISVVGISIYECKMLST